MKEQTAPQQEQPLPGMAQGVERNIRALIARRRAQERALKSGMRNDQV